MDLPWDAIAMPTDQAHPEPLGTPASTASGPATKLCETLADRVPQNPTENSLGCSEPKIKLQPQKLSQQFFFEQTWQHSVLARPNLKTMVSNISGIKLPTVTWAYPPIDGSTCWMISMEYGIVWIRYNGRSTQYIPLLSTRGHYRGLCCFIILYAQSLFVSPF